MIRDESVMVVHVRAAVPAGFAAVYVGRAMPGRVGSALGNPFRVGAGYAQGEAAAAFLPFLRERCALDSPQRRAVLTPPRRVVSGERLALQCWCAPRPCHAEHVRAAVLAYARLLEARG